MKDVVLPAVALAGGIASLYMDPSDKKKRLLFLAGLVGSTALTIAYNLQDSSQKAKALADAQVQEQQAKQNLDVIIDYLKQITEKIGLLVSNGMSPESAKAATPTQVATALSADALYQKHLGTPAKESSGNLHVVYFPKGVDQNRVFKAIQALGIAVESGPSQNSGETNAMWVGRDVPLESAKAVAFALMRAGVKLVAIRTSERRASETGLIQIGHDPALVNQAPKTPAEVEQMAAFSRSL